MAVFGFGVDVAVTVVVMVLNDVAGEGYWSIRASP